MLFFPIFTAFAKNQRHEYIGIEKSAKIGVKKSDKTTQYKSENCHIYARKDKHFKIEAKSTPSERFLLPSHYQWLMYFRGLFVLKVFPPVPLLKSFCFSKFPNSSESEIR